MIALRYQRSLIPRAYQWRLVLAAAPTLILRWRKFAPALGYKLSSVPPRRCVANENMVSEPVVTAARMARRLRAVLFVDVVDSVRLIQLDQDGTIHRWRKFMNDVMGNELPRRAGRMVKSLGDGMLVEFESAIDAVECALSMQARIEQNEQALPPESRIRLRMGI